MSENEIKPTPYTPGIIIKILLAALIAIGVFYLLMSIFYPVNDVLLAIGPPTLTPTVTQTILYETPTPRPSFTPTITITPTKTNTPLPTSQYNIPDFSTVQPDVPTGAEEVYILDNLDAEVDPPFSNFQWTSSDTIGVDIGREFSEQYYATFAPGSIEWTMDQSIPPGLYEIFVLDTLYSSGGFLDFSVTIGGEPIAPLVGRTLLQYNTTQSEPPQFQDEWRSIGVYDLQQFGQLSIATEWGNRDELSIVAVDRVMVIKRPENIRSMLSLLPNTTGTVFLLDDEDVTFSTGQYWNYWEDEQAWGGQYQVMSAPPLESSVSWQIPARLPHGDFEAYAWIPQANASIPVAYEFRAGGLLLPNQNDELQTEFPDGQGANQPGQWIKLGQWTVPEHFGNFVRIEIALTIPASDTGEVVIDAVAILQQPSQVPEE